MNILILGSSGFLGKKIYIRLNKSKKLNLFHNGIYKRKINLFEKKKLENLLTYREYSLIINCAAYTDIDFIERNKKTTDKINVNLIKDIFNIKLKHKLNFDLIHFSTDQVYNNKNIYNYENSKLSRTNHYAIQKILSEKICLKNKALVIRTNFFGKNSSKNKSLTDWIYKNFKKPKGNFNLFSDIYFNPIFVDNLADIIHKIIVKKKTKVAGIFNVGSKNGMSKKDFACLFAKEVNIYSEKAFTTTNSDNFYKVKRSKFMMMNTNKFEKTFKIKLQNLKHEIKRATKSYIS